MKLISYRNKAQQPHIDRYGVLLSAGVVDMVLCMDHAPASINDFVATACGDTALLAALGKRGFIRSARASSSQDGLLR